MHHIAPFPEDYTATAAYYTCARDNHIYVLFRHPQQAEDGRHATTEAPAYGAVRLRDGSLYFWNVPENQLNDTLDAQEFSRITNDSIEINIETVPPRPIAIDMGNRYATRIRADYTTIGCQTFDNAAVRDELANALATMAE